MIVHVIYVLSRFSGRTEERTWYHSEMFSPVRGYIITLLPIWESPLFPHFSSCVASMFLLSLYAICLLYARYLFSHLLDKYWTNTGQVLDKYWTSTEHEWLLLVCSILVALGLLTGYIGDVPLMLCPYRIPKGMQKWDNLEYLHIPPHTRSHSEAH